jgi:hypothetical protein
MNPTMKPPPPEPMSMNAVNDPSVSPRSWSSTRSTVKAMSAGKTSANPAPNAATPMNAGAGYGKRAMIARPTPATATPGSATAVWPRRSDIPPMTSSRTAMMLTAKTK